MFTKIYRDKYKNIYIMGCPHLYHNKEWIWKKRGFKSREQHTEAIINWLLELDENDLVICLGDMALNTSPKQLSEVYKKMKCHFWWMYGNHDSYEDQALGLLLPEEKEKIKCLGLMARFCFLFPGYKEGDKNEKAFATLAHYPHEEWELKNTGGWMIHAHCHGNNNYSLPNSKIMKRLDVSTDVTLKHNGTPAFKIEDIRGIMHTKDRVKDLRRIKKI